MTGSRRRSPWLRGSCAACSSSGGADFCRHQRVGPDAAARVSRASPRRGKMVRGGPAPPGLRDVRPPRGTGGRARAAAAALEIIHSSLLIHDDIMDNDRLRRGGSTVFAQYEQVGRGRRAADPARFGAVHGHLRRRRRLLRGMGHPLPAPAGPGAQGPRSSRWSPGELAYVGLAQMQDIAFGVIRAHPRPGRGDRPLPVQDGALHLLPAAGRRRPLAARHRRRAAQAGELGERLGVIFQVRDDDLGIFGTGEADRKARGVGHPGGEEDPPVPGAFPQGPRQRKRSGLEALFGKPDLQQGGGGAGARGAIEKLGRPRDPRQHAGRAWRGKPSASSIPCPSPSTTPRFFATSARGAFKGRDRPAGAGVSGRPVSV